MKKKICSFLILVAYSSIIYGNTDTYKITDGPFKNKIVTLKNTLAITQDNAVQKEIYNILLKRIADLDPKEKKAWTKNLKVSIKTQSSTQDNLFQNLPDSIKKGSICLCFLADQTCYIDQRFLKKNDEK